MKISMFLMKILRDKLKNTIDTFLKAILLIFLKLPLTTYQKFVKKMKTSPSLTMIKTSLEKN